MVEMVIHVLQPLKLDTKLFQSIRIIPTIVVEEVALLTSQNQKKQHRGFNLYLVSIIIYLGSTVPLPMTRRLRRSVYHA
jgi:hypothetical protein